jgi:uncharacterized protein (DUF2141 family)
MATAMRVFAGVAALAAAGSALADSAPPPSNLAKYADPDSVVLAVLTEFAAVGGEIRFSAYDNEQAFLERAAMKHRARVGEDGVAVVALRGLEPGPYAFVAYYDQNGDGRLNRSALGKPTEPVAFSNGVRPKLRKPTFDEAKVDVAPGAVVVMTMD